jgi:hypothetical protein
LVFGFILKEPLFEALFLHIIHFHDFIYKIKRLIMAEQVKKLSSWKKIGENIQWFFTEIMKIYSTQDSYFSKKRVESGIGFIIAEWGMIFFLMKKYETMIMTDFAIWAAMQFVVAGYMVSQIQKEKASESSNSVDATMQENQQ